MSCAIFLYVDDIGLIDEDIICDGVKWLGILSVESSGEELCNRVEKRVELCKTQRYVGDGACQLELANVFFGSMNRSDNVAMEWEGQWNMYCLSVTDMKLKALTLSVAVTHFHNFSVWQ